MKPTLIKTIGTIINIALFLLTAILIAGYFENKTTTLLIFSIIFAVATIVVRLILNEKLKKAVIEKEEKIRMQAREKAERKKESN